jgi:hypothetical protein
VTGIAAGNGGISSGKVPTYRGFAEGATIVFARISTAGSDSFDEGPLINGVRFLFDRGDALGKPIVVNLSLGTEVGPHDGTASWEGVLASFVGPEHPGHALVVAAGNSGSIVEDPTHQSVYVAQGTKMRVPIITDGAGGGGGVQVWLTMRAGASVSVGLEGPDGEWVSPVASGAEQGHNTSTYNSGVINGVDSDGNGGSASGQPGHLGHTPYALVLWSGQSWPSGVYNVTLEGTGTVELYVSGTGGANGSGGPHFAGGVREGTILIPASHPKIIAVGATVNKPAWTSIYGDPLGPRIPVLDDIGGFATGADRDAIEGEMAPFSSAGPTVSGVPKPEISAPGGWVVSSMSAQATPGTAGAIFTAPCPPPRKGGPIDPRCFQIDETHAVAAGTSMAAPMVAGAVAVLFERDRTLTQDKVTALLQAGAQRFHTSPGGPNPKSPPYLGDLSYVAAPFDDQGGPGELDVQGALDALDQMQNPALVLPTRAASWVTLSTDYFAADESMPLTAIFELRTADGTHRADMFDPTRFVGRVSIDGAPQAAPPLQKVAPGLWTMTIQLPRGLGGSSLTIGATFDGVDIVDPKTVPIGTDIWNAEYSSHAKGGCAVAASVGGGKSAEGLGFIEIVSKLMILGGALFLARRARRPVHSA